MRNNRPDKQFGVVPNRWQSSNMIVRDILPAARVNSLIIHEVAPSMLFVGTSLQPLKVFCHCFPIAPFELPPHADFVPCDSGIVGQIRRIITQVLFYREKDIAHK